MKRNSSWEFIALCLSYLSTYIWCERYDMPMLMCYGINLFSPLALFALFNNNKKEPSLLVPESSSIKISSDWPALTLEGSCTTNIYKRTIQFVLLKSWVCTHTWDENYRTFQHQQCAIEEIFWRRNFNCFFFLLHSFNCLESHLSVG